MEIKIPEIVSELNVSSHPVKVYYVIYLMEKENKCPWIRF